MISHVSRPYWPLFDLRKYTARLVLRPCMEADVEQLAGILSGDLEVAPGSWRGPILPNAASSRCRPGWCARRAAKGCHLSSGLHTRSARPWRVGHRCRACLDSLRVLPDVRGSLRLGPGAGLVGKLAERARDRWPRVAVAGAAGLVALGYAATFANTLTVLPPAQPAVSPAVSFEDHRLNRGIGDY